MSPIERYAGDLRAALECFLSLGYCTDFIELESLCAFLPHCKSRDNPAFLSPFIHFDYLDSRFSRTGTFTGGIYSAGPNREPFALQVIAKDVSTSPPKAKYDSHLYSGEHGYSGSREPGLPAASLPPLTPPQSKPCARLSGVTCAWRRSWAWSSC